MTFEELCTFEVLYDAYLTARKGKRNKAGTAQYEAQALACTDRLARLLLSGAYHPSKFETFEVFEPKRRLVQAPAFVDKVVQHALVDNILYDAITRSFIECNYASQIWKGMHFGLTHLENQMRDYYLKRKGHDEADRRAAGLPYRPREEWDYAEGWVLKADVRHFFASIDHDLLKEKLARKIEDPKVYDLMCVYIDSTDGLPLGYQTSQLLALLFLDEFDHWVKEKLHAKYYGRYMDDFYIISDSKEYLQGCWRQISGHMDALKLELNEKTAIFPLRNGINFLGFHTYLDDGGAVIMKLRQDSLDRMKARTRGWKEDKEAGTLDPGRGPNRQPLEGLGRPRRPRGHLRASETDRRYRFGNHRRYLRGQEAYPGREVRQGQRGRPQGKPAAPEAPGTRTAEGPHGLPVVSLTTDQRRKHAYGNHHTRQQGRRQ